MERLTQTDFWIDTIRVQPQLSVITVNGQTIHIEPRQMSLLVCLAERSGEVVSKEELLEVVWKDTFVTEQVLKVAISELRKALADSAREPRFIQTVPKQGYCLIAPVSLGSGEDELASPPAIVQNLVAPKKRISWLSTSAAALIILVAAFVVWKLVTARPVATVRKQIRSLAVLPLKNMSGDESEDYFTEGLTEALIADFASMTHLKVISRTSAMKYKDTAKTIPEIAAELNVDAIIEGSALRSGDRVRVIVQLIDGESDRHIWSQKYEREVKDLLTLQSDISLSVSRQIEAQLGRSPVPGLANAVKPEAYDAYLKGRYFWNKGGRENLLQSVAFYEQAVHLEPGFAEGLAGLADAHNFLGLFSVNDGGNHFSKARTAAQHAVTLAPDLAEAHSALAFNLMYADWNWKEAEKEFRLALELEPGHAIAHHWVAGLYSSLNRHEEAIREAQMAHTLDPLSPSVNSDLAWYYYYARRFEEAIRLCRRTLELDPTSYSMELCLQLCYQFTNQPESAVAELVKTLEREQRSKTEIDEIRLAFAQGGLSKVWRYRVRILEQMTKANTPRYYLLVLGHAMQGESDQSFYWLAQAFEKRVGWIPFLGTDPGLDFLRQDKRFYELLQRLGTTDGVLTIR